MENQFKKHRFAKLEKKHTSRNPNRIQMKRYKVTSWRIDTSKLCYLTEISNSRRLDGVRIYFLVDGRKVWQYKFKNNLLNGICKDWEPNKRFFLFQNLKKSSTQGIRISF